MGGQEAIWDQLLVSYPTEINKNKAWTSWIIPTKESPRNFVAVFCCYRSLRNLNDLSISLIAVTLKKLKMSACWVEQGWNPSVRCESVELQGGRGSQVQGTFFWFLWDYWDDELHRPFCKPKPKSSDVVPLRPHLRGDRRDGVAEWLWKSCAFDVCVVLLRMSSHLFILADEMKGFKVF